MKKIFIGVLIGLILGVCCGILGENILKPAFYKQSYLEVSEVMIPNVCIALGEKKTKAVENTDSNLKVRYDLSELSNREVNKYINYLKKDGFMMKYKDNKSGTTVLCKEAKEGKVANVEIFTSNSEVSINYSMFEGNIIVAKDRVSYLIDNELKYYDFKTKRGKVLVPSVENILSLKLKSEESDEYTKEYVYELDDSLTREQTEKYRETYVEFLKKNGYVNAITSYGEVYRNGCAQVQLEVSDGLYIIYISHRLY